MKSEKFHTALLFGASLLFIFHFSFFTSLAQAKEYGDSAVYQGMLLKLDLGNTVFELARSKAKQQSYEFSLSWDLQHRFFPTFEAGYARAIERESGNGLFSGHGGFARVGLDLSALKKNRKLNHLLIGVRVGSCLNQFNLSGHELYDEQGQVTFVRTYQNQLRADVWGEIHAGINVNIKGPFYMGLDGRMKFLFSRNPYHLGKPNEIPIAYYIPGYGYYDEKQFGFNYYIGFKF